MNRLARWMMRLYQARWRARYGAELEALLADTGADARVVADLMLGGVRMQFSTWSFPKLAVVLGLAGAALGTGVGWLMPSQYTSRATLAIYPTRTGSDEPEAELRTHLAQTVQQLETQVLSRARLAGFINDPDLLLYTDELKTTPLDDVIEEMRRNIQVQVVSLPGDAGRNKLAFDLVFTYPDKLKAQHTVAALAGALQSSLAERTLSSAATLSLDHVAVLDTPSLPARPVYPRVPVLLLAGLCAGIAAAAAWRAVRRTGLAARRFPLTASVLGAAGMLMVSIANELPVFPHIYRSSGTLQVRGSGEEAIQDIETQALSRTSLSQIINDPRLRLYTNQLQSTPLEDVIQTMKKHLNIRQTGMGDTTLLEITFDYPDRFKAQQGVAAIMNRIDALYRKRLGLQAGPEAPAIPMEMAFLDRPSLPVSPTKPNRYAIAWLGGLAGLTAAGAIALIRRRWKPEGDLPVDAVNG